MKHRRFHIGPGAASLILIIIVLSMSTLGVLALMNARSDVSLSRRSMDVTAQLYALNEAAELSLARVDAAAAACIRQTKDAEERLSLLADALPEDMTLEDGVVTWTEPGADGRSMHCAVRVDLSGTGRRVAWTAHELLTNTDEMGFDDLWN